LWPALIVVLAGLHLSERLADFKTLLRSKTLDRGLLRFKAKAALALLASRNAVVALLSSASRAADVPLLILKLRDELVCR
jgi:hypothetical protein